MHEQIPQPNPHQRWKRPQPWVTWLLVGSTVAVFIFQLTVYRREGEDRIGETLAFSPQAFADHRYWTLLTYAWGHAVEMFGHPDLFWLHIVANMIPLICIGPALEDFLGHFCYLGLYLGGAIAAAATWFFFNQNLEIQGGVLGASGAVFALIAGAGTAAPRARVVVYLLFFLPIPMRLGVLAAVVCALEALQIVFGWMPEVAHSAHLGGAVFGFFYVAAFRWLRERSRRLN